jgi:tryptophan 2,3-dioxygenase
MRSVDADALTPAEAFLACGLSSYVLLLSLVDKELLGLRRQLRRGPPSPALVGKGVARCARLAQLAERQGRLLRAVLLHRRPGLRYRLSGADPTRLTDLRQLRRRLRAVRAAVPEASPEGGCSAALRAADESLARVTEDLGDLLRAAAETRDAPAVPLEALISVTTLTALGDTSLRENHPQALRPGHGMDERTFVVIHQVAELWFVVAVRTLQEAIERLQGDPPMIQEATLLVDSLTEVLSWLGEMIHLPETIGVADYLQFRPQLAGSGMESPNFRQLQLLLQAPGQRGLDALKRQNLLTPGLDGACQGPSLDSAFRTALVRLGILSADDPAECVVLKLSRLFVPTAAHFEHRAAAHLMWALLKLAQQHKLWQTHHALMVETLIGSRAILSIGDVTGKEAPADLGGLPYLRAVLNSPLLFPELHAAVSRAQAGGQP